VRVGNPNPFITIDENWAITVSDHGIHEDIGGETYTLHTTVCDICRQLDDNQQPDFDVQSSFNGLGHLPHVVFHSSLVLSDALNGFQTILFSKESGCHRCIGQEEIHDA
jgi:hypothetical protein